jgi:hypothetical protein
MKSLNLIDLESSKIDILYQSSYGGNWGLKWLIEVEEQKGEDMVFYLIEK